MSPRPYPRELLQAGSARSQPFAHSLGKHCPARPSLGRRAGLLHESLSPHHGFLTSSKSLSVNDVTTLLGTNVGDLLKARSHPTISSWLYSLNRSTLGKLGLDTDPASPTGPTGPVFPTTGNHNTGSWASHLSTTLGRPGHDTPASGTAPHRAFPRCWFSPASAWPCLPKASMDLQLLLVPNLILHWPTLFPFASRMTFG